MTIFIQQKEAIEILVEISKMLTPLLLILSVLISFWVERRAKRRAEKAEKATNTVAETLMKTDTKTTRKLDTIHTLVNSGMGMQLKISSAALRRIADLTGKDADIAIADEAERLTKEHEVKQRALDSKMRENAEDAA